MAGVTVVGTGEAYTTIGAWEAAFNTASLTGVEECQLKNELYAEIVNVDGGSTTEFDYCHITTVEGAEFDHATRSGALISVQNITTTTDVVTIKDPYHRFGGNTPNNGNSNGSIGITYSAVSGVSNCSALKFRYAGNNVIYFPVMFDLSGDANVTGIWDDGTSTGNIDVFGAIVMDTSTISTAGGDATSYKNAGGTAWLRLFHCISDNIYAGPGADDAIGFQNNLMAVNCWSSRDITDAPAGSTSGFLGIGTMTNCASDDGTSSVGLQNLDLSLQFQNTVIGQQDFHLVAGSSLIGAGASTSMSTDIDMDSWAVPPSVGVDEPTAQATTEIFSSFDSVLQKTNSATSNPDAVLSSTLSSQNSADTAIASDFSVSTAIDSLLRSVANVQTSAQAAIKKIEQANLSIDSVTKASKEISAQNDSTIRRLAAMTAESDAAVLARLAEQIGVDSALIRAIDASSNTDAILRAVADSQVSVGAILSTPGTYEQSQVDSMLLAVADMSAVMDSTIQTTLEVLTSTNSILTSSYSNQISVDSTVETYGSIAVESGAVVSSGGTLSQVISDSLVQASIEVELVVDAIVATANSIPQLSDARLVMSDVITSISNAILTRGIDSSSTTDAVVVTESEVDNVSGFLRAYSPISGFLKRI